MATHTDTSFDCHEYTSCLSRTYLSLGRVERHLSYMHCFSPLRTESGSGVCMLALRSGVSGHSHSERCVCGVCIRANLLATCCRTRALHLYGPKHGWRVRTSNSCAPAAYSRLQSSRTIDGTGCAERLLKGAAYLLSLRDAPSLAPDEKALLVVRQRTRLECDDVLALDEFEIREGVGGHRPTRRSLPDRLLVDHVGVLPDLGVGDVDLVALLEFVEVPERQPAFRM